MAKVRRLTGVAILPLILAGVLLTACVAMPSPRPTQDRTGVPTALSAPADTGTPPATALGQGAAQADAVPVGYAMTGQVTRTVYLPSTLQQTNGSLSCPTITGWQGLYWNNGTLSGAATLCRNDADLAFNWGLGSPDPRLPADHFSARWTRRVNLAAGRYRFHLAADDGVRLWIDGNLAIDDWKIQLYAENMVDRDLTAGLHDLKVEYFENVGQAAVSLTWEQLPSACPNHFAQYYNNTTLSGRPTFTQCEP
ncbi:MAG TPA: PA14 domain-containing protein, partial [Anaerolineae bacterium]